MGPILITGADRQFFPLVRGTILSIRDKPQGRHLPLGFLDLGCTEEQLTWVRSQGAQIVVPPWEFDFPNQENTPNYLKGLLARPFFRKYFPNYELYLWIDADAWVQDWQAIELFFQGARKRKGLTIVPEIHGPNDFVSLAGKIPAVLGYGRQLYCEVFDEAAANLYHIYPLLNAGVFCLHRDAPHWEPWAQYLYTAAQKAVTVMTDQMALHFTVFAGTVPTEIQLPPIITETYLRTEFLPGWCNFLIGNHLPTWDETQQAFVERYLPHQKLGIVHNTGTNKLQRDRVTVPTVQGTTVDVSLYYSQVQATPDSETPSEVIVITGADSNYFSLVQGTILSIRNKPQGKNVALGFLDVGCTEAQLAWVRSQGAQIVVPKWEFDFPQKAHAPHYLPGLWARPFLRQYFPGYTLYLWLDADSWVQDWQAVECFCEGARQRKGLAIAPEVFGASDGLSLTGKIPGYLGAVYQLYREGFDEETARRYRVYPLLSTRAFCLHVEAPHWEAWAQNLYRVAQKMATALTDVLALHYTVFVNLEGMAPMYSPLTYLTDTYLRTEFLPGWCSFWWRTDWPSPWDEAQQGFVERFLPHQKLGIVHNLPLEKRREPEAASAKINSQSFLNFVDRPILITGADRQFFPLAKGTVLSIREKPEGANIALGFLDLGCTEEQLAWVRSQGAQIVVPQWEFDFPNQENTPNYLKGLLARPFFRKYFPGYDLYLWIDADAWVQDWEAIALLLQGAAKQKGLAIVPELHGPNDFLLLSGKTLTMLSWIQGLYAPRLGKELALKYSCYPSLNAGVFCLHAEAPHWEIWAANLQQAAQNGVDIMTDQVALQYTVFGGTLRETPEEEAGANADSSLSSLPSSFETYKRTEFLPGWCNFLVFTSLLPTWDDSQQAFVERYLPRHRLGIVHNAGGDKFRRHWIGAPTTAGSIQALSLYYNSKYSKTPMSISTLPQGDYISPGLHPVFPDAAFPHKIVGDTRSCAWPYLRREIPHNWYVDQRHPYIGFLSRDEAHILYNNALQFRGKPALEVGCWMGWSAVHLALAGVHLDIIDPILENSEARHSVESSLEAARQEFPEFGSYVLYPGYSPQKVEELAQTGKRWSLIFIDGNHDRPAPLQDAQTCAKYAARDAMILFHDLASPEVTEGLDFLRCTGWNVMVYQTMQVMGVAWRGNVQPVRHVPDPAVNWTVPEHLRPYPICGTPEELEFRELAALVQPYTLLQDCRLYSLYRLTREICEQDRPGNLVECGSYKGGAAALMAAVVKRYSRRSRRVFACDTFAGMPEPTEVDRHQGIPANDTGFGVGTLAAPVSENLTKVCETLGVQDLVVPVVGLFAETLPQFRSQMGAIALLHADGDWYESTRDIFQNLYDVVIPGGVIQINDYGHWEGCRQAVTEFAAARRETWNLQPIDYTGVYFYKPQGRDFRSALQPPLLQRIQQASLQYSYRGIRMVKNPFDFALYPLLLWQQKPKTLIEVGSFYGGSALWFADLMTTYGLEGRVYSVDINLVTAVSHPKVTFLQGDQTQLEKVFGPEFWATVERPLLVIEDGAHFYETSKAVLDFFQPHLQPGEYIVIEDGIVDDLGETQAYRGGPNRAIQEFLAEWGEHYEIDTAFCDFFGHNVTWNTNGYLRKVKATPTLAEKLGLRQRNLVIFPDWSQFEEAVYEQLQGVWRAILHHPQCGETALLIATIGENPEACDEMVSSAAMEVLALEDVSFEREPQVIFAHQLTTAQWQELRSQLTGRLVLESELPPPLVLADLPALALDDRPA